MASAAAAIYDPSPIQREFHLAKADEILLGGAAGPGKSLCLLMDPIQTQMVFEHERWKRGEIQQSEGWAIHFRREFPMLAQTIDRAHRIFRKIDPNLHWDGDARTFRFSCGYKIQFAHLKDDKDVGNYDSNQYTHLAFDELVQFTRDQYDFLVSRVRSSDAFLRSRLRIVSATNPAGNWVRDYFVDQAPKGRVLFRRKIKLEDGTTEEKTRVFIPATLRDNPDPGFRRDYEARLSNLPPHIRLARLNGDWYVVAGAFFAEEWVPDVHVVKPFKIPSGWNRFRSMDWGYKSYCVVHWWAVDKDGNLICYRERNFRYLDADAVAKRIMDIEQAGDGVATDEWDPRKDCSRLSGPADTQIWEQRGTIGPTIAETMSHRGIWWEKCTKNKHAAVQQLFGRLKNRDGERPGITIFDTCQKAIATIPAIETSDTDPELPMDGGDDHWLDSFLYACMYRMSASKEDRAPRYPDDELARRRRQSGRRGGGRYGYGGSL